MLTFDRLFAAMTRPWVVIAYFGLTLLSFCYFDKAIAVYFYQLQPSFYLKIVHWITWLGFSVLYFSIFLITALFLRYIRMNQKGEERAWFLLLSVVIPGGLCHIFKIIFGRARPGLWVHDHLYGFYWFKTQNLFWSFPSGHTSVIMGVAFGLSIVFPRYLAAFILAGLLVASSRIVLHFHFLSDVLASSYLALLEIGLLLYSVRRRSWLMSAWVS